ncbi:MAG: hypothetical protein PHZ25_00580 [Candidatus Pacebacteria bacterium]|nr:hypothetical protein [Candidatus Paceibacterota bacterium]
MFFWLKNNWKKTALLAFFLFAFSFVSFNFALAQELPASIPAPKDGDVCSSSPSCPEKLKTNDLSNHATYNAANNIWIATYPNGSQDYFDTNGNRTESIISNSGIGKKTTTTYDETGEVLNSKTENTLGLGSFLSGFASSALEAVFGFFLSILLYITNLVFVFGSWMVDFAFDLNSRLMKMPIILSGWSFARDFANLGFVLGILVISFATIIRQRQYGMQSLLFKFIQTAILINFSLVICGVLIDFAGIVTAYFLNEALVNQSDISSAFGKLLNIDNLNGVNLSSLSGMKTATALSASFVVNVASLIFVILFTAFSAIFLIGLSIMLVYRFIALSFLLILAPLAWFTGIFPKINYSGAWWSSFIRWTFFAPVSSFFIFLSIRSLTGVEFSSPSSSTGAAFGAMTIIQNGLGQIGGMIVILGFLFGSMMAADKFGIQGAKGTINWANWVKNGATNWLRNTSSKAALGTGRFAYGQTIGRSGVGKGIENWAKNTIKSEKSGRLGLLTAKTVLGVKKRTTDTIFENYKKEAKNLSPDQISASARIARDPVKKAALQELLAEKGKLDKYPEYINPTLFEKYGGDVKKLSSSNILYSTSKNKKDPDAKSVVDAIGELTKIEKNNPEEFSKAISSLEESLVKALSEMKTEDIKKGAWLDIAEKGMGSGMSEDAWKKEGGRDAFYRAISRIKPKEFNAMTKGFSQKDRNVFANRTALALINKSLSEDKKIKFDENIIFQKDITKENIFTEAEKKSTPSNPELLKHLKNINTLTADDSGGEKKEEEEKSEEKKK